MNTSEPHTANNLVDHLFRKESGKMTAILTRIFGFRNSVIVEDIVQETFLSAMKTWPLKGQPDNPSAWLMQVAKNKAINAIKRRKKMRELHPEIEVGSEQLDQLFMDHEIKDSQLRMFFECCYPELPAKTQIMLTLKTMSGFSDKEIASALLMSPAAVKKSIYRAKQEIQAIYVGLNSPNIREAKNRLDVMYMVIYLVFNEGYKRSYEEQVISEDLCFEAVRLANLILNISGVNHGKTHALLSLMFFSIARFPARKGNRGEIIDLKFQDRSLWDKSSIDAGFHHLRLSRESNSVSRFHLESAIASLHCSASSFKETNWEGILSCYKKLLAFEDSAIIRLNYAIALSKVEGPEAGLEALNQVDLDSSKEKQFMLLAAKADMNAELENYELAKSYYQVASDMAVSPEDREFLREKIEECDRKNVSRN